ncbi:MAG: hypothetical protein DRJ37_03890 [Thermoprotei archaeon]|nr:MAG: hypothetical protein DRJ37_03890 [Thermoprotei archaeon]
MVYTQLKESEFQIVKNIKYSWTIRELARRSSLSYSKVWRFLQDLKGKGKIYFMVNYRRLNLAPVILITRKKEKIYEMPPYTMSIREIYGLKRQRLLITAILPPDFVRKYLDLLGLEIETHVKGYEYIRWSYNDKFSIYVPNLRIIVPVYGNIEKLAFKYDYPVETNYTLDAPDIIDLAIIHGKSINVFMTSGEAVNFVRRIDPLFPRVSKQLISYHARKHVKELFWRGNTINFFAPMSSVPIRIWYFEGRDAPIISRILANIPTFFSATIDVEKAVVVGQPPCNMIEDLYKRVFSIFEDVEMPLGELVLSSRSMQRFQPHLWRLVEKGKWMWIDEPLYVLKR